MKVDSIGARFASEQEFDGVTRCTSVDSSGESKVGLLDSGNRATLDRHNVAQVCTEAMRAPFENKPKLRIFAGRGHGQRVEILKGILRPIEIQMFNKCGLGGERFTSLGTNRIRRGKDRQRRSCLHRSERVEQTRRRENRGRSTGGS
jgi:hypothetical protein